MHLTNQRGTGNTCFTCRKQWQQEMLLRIGPLKLPDSSQLHRHDHVHLLFSGMFYGNWYSLQHVVGTYKFIVQFYSLQQIAVSLWFILCILTNQRHTGNTLAHLLSQSVSYYTFALFTCRKRQQKVAVLFALEATCRHHTIYVINLTFFSGSVSCRSQVSNCQCADSLTGYRTVLQDSSCSAMSNCTLPNKWPNWYAHQEFTTQSLLNSYESIWYRFYTYR